MDVHLKQMERSHSFSPDQRRAQAQRSGLRTAIRGFACYSPQHTQAYQVVHSHSKGQHPADPRHFTVLDYSAIRYTGMSGQVLRHVWRDPQLAQLSDEHMDIAVPVVGLHHTKPTRDRLNHCQDRIPRSGPHRLREPRNGDQIPEVFHRYMAQIRGLHFLCLRLLLQAGLGMGCRSMRAIRMLHAPTVDVRGAGILGGLWWKIGMLSLATLLPNLGLDPRSVHGEVLAIQPLEFPGLP